MDDVRVPISVKMLFMLAGKSKDFGPKNTPDGWTNEDTLGLVKTRIASTLRDTTTHVVDEATLVSSACSYPRHYVAGWFISTNDPLTELVVVAHADSVSIAKKILIDSVQNISWDTECVLVE